MDKAMDMEKGVAMMCVSFVRFARLEQMQKRQERHSIQYAVRSFLADDVNSTVAADLISGPSLRSVHLVRQLVHTHPHSPTLVLPLGSLVVAHSLKPPSSQHQSISVLLYSVCTAASYSLMHMIFHGFLQCQRPSEEGAVCSHYA